VAEIDPQTLHETPDDAPPHLRFLATKIVERVRISAVIALTVKLKRQGRELRGRSPFADDEATSLFVNDDQGLYHCFASKRSGNVIRWVMEVEGMPYDRAVMHLASFLGSREPL